VSDLAKHQLAGLAALDRMIEIAMRALVHSYPEFGREIRPTDTTEVRSAAALVDLCAQILAAIDRHRRLVARDVLAEDRNWPF
jgi:hypothetical protein